MVLFHNRTRPSHPWPVSHGFWATIFVVGTIAGIGVYFWEFSRHPWPTGSTFGLFWTGVVAAVLMLFEFLLWPRKKLRAWRLFGSGLLWMKAHIWLGLLTFPLALLHCGFYFRGWLANALAVVFLLVFLSGLYGLAVQQVLPRMLLNHVPGETIYSQIPLLIAFLRRDAEILLRHVKPDFRLQTLPDDPLHEELREERADPDQQMLVVGHRRELGAVHQDVFESQIERKKRQVDDELLQFFEKLVEPFLRPEFPVRHPLADARRSSAAFAELRSRASSEVTDIIDLLEGLVDQRRQLAIQARLHRLLHNWLLVHVPLSVVLMVLLVAHIWIASVYSGFPWIANAKP